MLQLPPGKYFIGDPCYVFDDDKDTWDKLIDTPGFFEGAIIELNGIKLWAHSTAYGDGSYNDQNGNEYGVDSGMLGAVPIELVEDPSGESLGRVIDAPNGLTVSYEDGTFYLGNTVIETDDNTDFPDPYAGDEDDDDLTPDLGDEHWRR